jgi:hypothetical protein
MLNIWIMSLLHINARCCVSALLEGDCSHLSSFVRLGHQLSVIISNAEHKAWSQDKHLRELGHLVNTVINTRSDRS